MRAGKLTPKDVSDIVYDTWVKLYETELSATATSVTISGLLGDTDLEYKLECRFINGYDGSTGYGLRPNNDSTPDIYGYQQLSGVNAATGAARDTTNERIFLYKNEAAAIGNIIDSTLHIHAKTGFVRTFILETASDIATTTVSSVGLTGQSYNETSTEITSLVIFSVETGGLGIGSNITLWKRAYK